jgi:hypothetical protein
VNCDDYIARLATLPVEELAYGHPRAHAAACRDCDRVTRVVAERERNMLLAYGDVHSSVPAVQVAARAAATSRRRTTAFFYKTALGITAAATVLYMALSRTVAESPQVTTISDTFQLQCLSPAQAVELLRPHIHLPTSGFVFRDNAPSAALTVEASPEDMATVRSVLDHFDNAAQSRCVRR